MSRLKQVLILFCFIGFLFFNGCRNDSSIAYHILHIEGVAYVCNVSTSYISFGPVTSTGEAGRLSIPAADGDLLFLMDSEDSECYFRYRREEGNNLSVTYDTANARSVYINGSLSFLEFTDRPSCKDAFEALSATDIKQLSCLYFPDRLTREMIDVLRVHEASLQGTGVVLEDGAMEGVTEELLSICRPDWLVIHGDMEIPETAKNNYLSNLKLLWVTEELHPFSSMIPCCSNLESMIISDWQVSEGELVPLSSLKNLRSLTFAGCGIEDLSPVELPASLERLHIIGCDTLQDLEGLEKLLNLSSLSLNGSELVESRKVDELSGSLKWISFPPGVTQEEFLQNVNQQDLLEIVEINECTGITDISPLQDLKNLKVLIYNADEYDLPSLGTLERLELLVLNSTLFDETPDQISQLQTQLPQTEIVPGTGLCLGSGWLLLMIPVVLLSRMLFRARSQTKASG